jgi:serine protease Do
MTKQEVYAQWSAAVGALLFFLTIAATSSAEPIFQEGDPQLAGVPKAENMAPPSFSYLAKELSPAVVNVAVETEGTEDSASEDSPLPPYFKIPPNTPMRSLGSGFILTEDGYIATNNHVIEKSTKIIVRLLNDKTEYTAKIIGIDPKTDLALVKIEPKQKLKTVFLGDSDKIEVGDWVVAIGNQFQLGQTVTAGIVSATSRRVPTSSPYDAFIQTDASINPGSSGGPLFNIRGQVVGINTAIFSPGRSQFGGPGFNIGIGFAIPINLVKGILRQLKDQGKVTRGLLGVMIQKIDADMAEALNLNSPNGALVSDVMPDTPASKAGFKRKDVIVRYNGQPVNDHDELPLLVASTAVGTSVKVEILRDGAPMTITAQINELKESAGARREESAHMKPDKLGLAVSPVTPEVAALYKLPSAAGLLVEQVETNSPADRSGIVRGDIIEQLADVPMSSVDAYAQIVKSLKKEKPVLILIRKSEGTRFLTLRFK